jgi:Peptidase family M28
MNNKESVGLAPALEVAGSTAPASKPFPVMAYLTPLLIALFAFLGIYRLNPPAAVPANSSLTEFSSGRAMKHIEAIAQKPHPIGTPAHDEAREYIEQQFKAIGLGPQVQKTTALDDLGNILAVANVQNVIARLDATDSGKAVLLVAHYDSVANSPGASDDAAGVATVIETARALKEGPPLKNDVIFLITDCEERGLLGAIAFQKEHPWMKDVGLVLNFEARGNSGPAIMFETSNNNGWLIQEFGKAVHHPVANSLSYEIYKMLGRETDMTIFKDEGIPGLNFAYINGSNHNHFVLDSLYNIDERSVQHQGTYALDLTRHFGNLNLEGVKSVNAVYFDVLGGAFFNYSQRWVVPLTALATLLFAGVIVLGLRRARLSFGGIIKGFLVVLASLIATPLAVTIVWWGIRLLHKEYRVFRQEDIYNDKIYFISFAALTIALVSLLYSRFHKRIGSENLAIGGLLCWLIFVVLTTLKMPGGTYLFTWPLLFSLLGFGLIFASKDGQSKSAKSMTVLTLFAVPGIILLVPMTYLVFAAMSLSGITAEVFMMALLLSLLIPQLAIMTASNKWALPGTFALLSVILLVVGSLTARFDNDHPKPNSVFYAMNADAAKAVWASIDSSPDEWTSQFLSNNVQRGDMSDYLFSPMSSFLKSDAPIAALPVPDVAVLDDVKADGARRLRVRVMSGRQAPIMSVYVNSNGETVRVVANGKETTRQLGNRYGLNFFGVPPEGFDLTMETKTNEAIKIRVVDLSYGLPQIPGMSYSPRPNYMAPLLYVYNDSTVVSKSYTF